MNKDYPESARISELELEVTVLKGELGLFKTPDAEMWRDVQRINKENAIFCAELVRLREVRDLAADLYKPIGETGSGTLPLPELMARLKEAIRASKEGH